MGDELPVFTAAAVQAAPVFMDRDATAEKACGLIEEAAANGARLVVFPETWIPTYPWWTSTPALFSARIYADLWRNAVEVPSPTTERLGAAAKGAGAWVVIGINERDTASRGTLYNTLLYLAPDGSVLHKHRKLVPTFTERTVWGFGDGSDLRVLETPLGRLGGLICWEHEVTLAKYALYGQGEQLHCATWPAYSSQNDHIDFGMRQYAFEGACFVVSACGVRPEPQLPPEYGGGCVEANGGSAIVGPDGRYLAGPVYDREEIVYAEIDLTAAIREKHSRDVAGHYGRPDVFHLSVNSTPKPVLSFAGERAAGVTRAAVRTHEVVDRLETVRAYLGSLIDRIEADGDSDANEALSEALASIDMAAAGLWSRE
ncbi:MAG: carbon-nitrogen hydrolase family protein [Dehalococcoidia bacterium]|nr:carbon-nitrogen hydrolase family protein [Dehalococcoidia bacterium]